MTSSPHILLRCTACGDKLRNPATLTCSHTFCRQCVVTHTQSRDCQPGALVCPFCQQLTTYHNSDTSIGACSVHDGNREERTGQNEVESVEKRAGHETEKQFEEWAGQIEPSLVVRGLLEANENNSAQVNCDPCGEEGETTPADSRCPVCDVALCEACVKAHRKNPASRHHQLADVNTDLRVKRRYMLMCSDHQDEAIEYYCQDCNKSLCQSCFNCKHCHKNCKKVKALADMTSEMEVTLQDSKGVLSAIVSNQDSKVSELQSMLDGFVSLQSSFKEQITSRFNMIRDILNSKERDLVSNLESVTDPTISKFRVDIREAKMARDVSEQKCELIDHVLESKNEMFLFETYLSCQPGVVQLVNGLVTEPGEITPDIRFSQNTDKLMQTIQELEVGHFEMVTEDQPESALQTSTENFQHLNLELINNASTRAASDKEKPNPTDIIVVDVNGESVVVVADWGGNHAVKSFFTRGEKVCSSRLSLAGGPYSLCSLKEKEIALTLPDSKQILTVAVSPELKQTSTICTRKEYWGLTALPPSTLAAGSQSPSCVDILNLAGSVLRTLRPHSDGGSLLKYPNFLCTSREGNILVSDCGTKTVLCLTPEGEVVFNYVPQGGESLKSPRGITFARNGDVLVADFSLHRVVHLSASGVHIEAVTSPEIQYPHGLSVHESGALYISLYADGFIKTFSCNI